MKKYCVDCSIKLKLFLEADNEKAAETDAINLLDAILYESLEFENIEYGRIDYDAECQKKEEYPKEPAEGTALAVLLDKIREQNNHR